jgi:hypothetical protein
MEALTPQAQHMPDVFSDTARMRASTSSSLGCELQLMHLCLELVADSSSSDTGEHRNRG